MEDISPRMASAQFGKEKGTSKEHLLVNIMDKILKLIDQHPNKSAVTASYPC